MYELLSSQLTQLGLQAAVVRDHVARFHGQVRVDICSGCSRRQSERSVPTDPRSCTTTATTEVTDRDVVEVDAVGATIELADFEADRAGEVDGEGGGRQRVACRGGCRPDLHPRDPLVGRGEQAPRSVAVGSIGGVTDGHGARPGGSIEAHRHSPAVASPRGFCAGLDIGGGVADQRIIEHPGTGAQGHRGGGVRSLRASLEAFAEGYSEFWRWVRAIDVGRGVIAEETAGCTKQAEGDRRVDEAGKEAHRSGPLSHSVPRICRSSDTMGEAAQPTHQVSSSDTGELRSAVFFCTGEFA
jgi:hypothetical protein